MTDAKSKAECIRDGITLILSAEPGAECCASHDMFMCGSFSEDDAELAAKLDALGWFEHEDSWAVFT